MLRCVCWEWSTAAQSQQVPQVDKICIRYKKLETPAQGRAAPDTHDTHPSQAFSSSMQSLCYCRIGECEDTAEDD